MPAWRRKDRHRELAGIDSAYIAYPTQPSSEYVMKQLLSSIRKFDQSRPSFPGEHFIVGALGSSLLASAARRRGFGRLLALLVGGALVARAASGRDGLARKAQQLKR